MAGKGLRSKLDKSDTEDEFEIEYYKSAMKKVSEKLIRILNPLLSINNLIILLEHSQRFQTHHVPIRADFLPLDFKSASFFLGMCLTQN